MHIHGRENPGLHVPAIRRIWRTRTLVVTLLFTGLQFSAAEAIARHQRQSRHQRPRVNGSAPQRVMCSVAQPCTKRAVPPATTLTATRLALRTGA